MKTLPKATSAICGAQMIDERVDYLDAYCEGWSRGDSDMIYSVVADDYVWDDLEEGRVSKDGLNSFLPKIKDAIDRARGCSPSASYLTLSDWVVDRSQLSTTFWCSFAVPGTSVEGLCQIRVGDDGVISERRAYRTKSHVRTAGIRGKR